VEAELKKGKVRKLIWVDTERESRGAGLLVNICNNG
jgi:hypothetical protein